MLIAITRSVSPAMDRCELAYIHREPIDIAKADAQHKSYEERLTGLGAQVIPPHECRRYRAARRRARPLRIFGAPDCGTWMSASQVGLLLSRRWRLPGESRLDRRRAAQRLSTDRRGRALGRRCPQNRRRDRDARLVPRYRQAPSSTRIQNVYTRY